MKSQNKLPVLVLGSETPLGCSIVHKLVSCPDTFQVSLVIKEPLKCQDLCQQVETTGGKIITANIGDPSAVKDITKGIHTVISALEGDELTFYKPQLYVLEDAVKNGVQRFVPGEFCVNLDGLSKSTNYCIDLVLSFREHLQKTNLKPIYFANGIIMDYYFSIVDKIGEFWYWDDPNRRIQLTTLDNISQFLSHVIKDPNFSGDVKVFGTEITVREIAEIFNHLTGRNLPLIKMGTMSELKDLIKYEKDQENWTDYFKLSYFYLIFGEDTLIKDRMNNNWPDVKITSIEEFLNKTKGKAVIQHPFPEVKEFNKEKLAQYTA